MQKQTTIGATNTQPPVQVSVNNKLMSEADRHQQQAENKANDRQIIAE